MVKILESDKPSLKKPIGYQLDLLMGGFRKKREEDELTFIITRNVFVAMLFYSLCNCLIFTIAIILLYSFYRWKDLEAEMLNILPKVK